jgi:hypothetical protein
MMPHRLCQLTAPLLAFLAVHASAAVLYVDLNCTSPTPPYTNWMAAATNIQDAVDASSPGDTVLVTNGVYNAGGHVLYGVTNRITVTKAIMVQSINGPEATVIQGYQQYSRFGNVDYGPASVRCAYLTNGAMLAGFTLTNGSAQSPGQGGGVYCESASAVVSNCVLIGNSVDYRGGGACFGTLNNCTIIANTIPYGDGGGANGCIIRNCALVNNSAGGWGGGASSSTLFNCTLAGNHAGQGGGAEGCTLNSCLVASNSVVSWGEGGGGARDSVLNHSLVVSNYGGRFGGGTLFCTLNHCTVVGNWAEHAGGVDDGALTNCILSGNSASIDCPNYRTAVPDHCCATPDGGTGSITNAPLFVDLDNGNFRLRTNSPCINAGNNAALIDGPDLDGNPRVKGGTVDMGAYEFQTPASTISYAWLQQYGLPTDGSADHVDSDHDGMNNWGEWKAGTEPTDALSVLQMLAPSNSVFGVTVRWQSVSGRTYCLQRGTHLGAQTALEPIEGNIVGEAGMTSFTDTTATNAGTCFYRVGVQ